MAVFVLVHGACLGGWCWDDVRVRLEASGHRVLAPTLPNDRPTLAAYVAAVAGLLEAEDLWDVVLVGHSFAGMIITGVADQTKPRIAKMVYLDAAVPGNGDDFASWVPGLSEADAESRRTFFRSMSPDGVWLPPPPLHIVGVTDPVAVAEIMPRLVSHPLATWLEPLVLGQGGTEGIPKTYVVATSPSRDIMGYPRFAAAARNRSDWTVREVAAGHAMMLAAPDETAAVLLDAIE